MTIHTPVMLAEVLAALDLQPGQVVVDATAGGGGHLRELAHRVGAEGRVLAIDRDPGVIERLASDLTDLPAELQFGWGSYADLPEILDEQRLPPAHAILLDLGLSSDQLADAARGFSFHIDGPLDLRFNPLAGEPAWRLLERLSAEHLADLIYAYGEERQSRRIARAIVDARRREPLRSAKQLADVIRQAVGRGFRDRIDPATRTFQALRIAVNQELDHLRRALRRFPDCLVAGGRLAVISFHSLEDRLVKDAFRDDPRWTPLSRKPIRPTDAEVLGNPRSRSAKLRVAQRAE
jgi:16S rRNA (cytosine1402-N4)-methyltransferase